MSVAAFGRQPARSDSTWVWSRSFDLLLGCGLGYMLVVPLLVSFAISEDWMRWPPMVVIAIGTLVSGPHYGATLLRVYEKRSERKRFATVAVWTSLALVALTGIGVHATWVGSLLVTAYVTWAPWHFAGQNYGLALMFLGRRAVPIDRLTKRIFHASFVLSALISVLPLHGGVQRVSYAVEVTGVTDSVQLLRLGIPEAWIAHAVWYLFALYGAGLLFVAYRLVQRSRHWIDLVPPALLVSTQALWYAIPRVVESTMASSLQPIVLMSIWISAAHALQYLWISSHFARRESSAFRLDRYLIKATLAGAAIFFIPAIALSPSLLGNLPFSIGLFSVVSSAVNLHHFVLDGAIWKLRDSRVAEALLRTSDRSRIEGDDPPKITEGLGTPVYVAGLCGLATTAYALHLGHVIYSMDVDHAAKRSAAERLAWIGRESPDAFASLAQARLRADDDEGAIADYRRAVEIFPREDDLRRLGMLFERNGRLDDALDTNAAVLDLSPDNPRARVRRAMLLDRRAEVSEPSEAAGLRRSAIASLEIVLDRVPGHAVAARALSRLLAELGKLDRAVSVLESAERHSRGVDERFELRREAERLRRQSREKGQ